MLIRKVSVFLHATFHTQDRWRLIALGDRRPRQNKLHKRQLHTWLLPQSYGYASKSHNRQYKHHHQAIAQKDHKAKPLGF